LQYHTLHALVHPFLCGQDAYLSKHLQQAWCKDPNWAQTPAYTLTSFAYTTPASSHTPSFFLSAAGMELYPRIGKGFDLKTWTNCRMGMMGWAFWILCFAVKQYQSFGHVSNAMMVSVLLMEMYIFKFFL